MACPELINILESLREVWLMPDKIGEYMNIQMAPN